MDQATGGWGHLTLDHVMLTDQAAVPRSDETTVNLVVDGQVVRTATGANSEVLDWASWNVAEFKGRRASIRVVDNNRFGWGHILADEFVASPRPATPTAADLRLAGLRPGLLRLGFLRQHARRTSASCSAG